MRLALALLAALVPAALQAKKPEEPKQWDVQTAMPGKTVKFTVEEGTWLNLDVSPDGRTIVFDLLGDLYTMPVEGGKAKRISGGPAWEVQPRFSPDGREIAFSSDRGGGHNLWRMPVKGGEPKAVTKEDFRLYNNPVWTPDGDYLIGRKHFTGQRSLGAGELWLVHKTGGAGLQLTKQKNDQQDQGEPAVSPDGRYVYFSEDVTAGPFFQYNKNPHDTIYAIRRLDRQTGEIENLIQSPGGAVRPQPSPDGKQLAFVKRVREKTVLHVMELDTGIVRPVWDGLSHDQQEAWAIFGPYPNFDWLPDSSAVVIWAQGQFWRVAIDDGAATKIPFSAEVEQKLAPALRFERPLEGEDFEPKMIRDVATSPDGRTLVFHAVGKLWTKSLPNGKPRRLTADETHFEYQPAFHPAGGKLLYTTWSDAGMGAVQELDLASGERRTLTPRKGYYYGPAYSPDGSRIVYIRSGGGSLTGGQHTREAGIYVMPAAGGEAKRIARQAGSPQFSADGTRVYYLTGGGLSKKLMSVGLEGEEPREVFNLKYVNDVVISPDGRWVAFSELFNAYVAPMPQTGGVIELSKDVQGFPVTKVSADVGSYLHWSPDSKQLHWMVGREYHTLALNQAFAFLEGAPKELPKPGSSKGIDIGLTVPTDQPQDVVAFVGGRVITMRDPEQRQEIIEDGVVVVRGESIAAVGPRGEVAIPTGARIVDAKGKTLMPGFVDVHAHAAHFGAGVVPQQNWAYYANLAYGITTMHDPSASTEFVFSQSELVKAGTMVGPRVTSTGTILYGADGDFKAVINSLDDARSHLKRMKAQWRVQREELQPAASRPAPAGQHRRARARHAGGGGGRLDLLPQPDDGPGRRHRRGAQPAGRTALRRCRRPLGPQRGAQCADAGGALRWHQRRALVVCARRGLEGGAPEPLLPARDPRCAVDPPRDRARLGLLAHRGREGQEEAARCRRAHPRRRPRPDAGPGAALGDVDVRAGRLHEFRGAARGDHRRRRLHRFCEGARLARGRQARRPRRARRQPARGHSPDRFHLAGHGQRPLVRREGRDGRGRRQAAPGAELPLATASQRRAGLWHRVRPDRRLPLPEVGAPALRRSAAALPFHAPR
jgi:Tol biopolymer transport system component